MVQTHKVDYGDGAQYLVDGDSGQVAASVRGQGVGAKASYSLLGDQEKLDFRASDKVTFTIDGINKQMLSGSGLIQFALDGLLNQVCMQAQSGSPRVCVRAQPLQITLQMGDLRIVFSAVDGSINILLGMFGIKILPGGLILFNLGVGACIDLNKAIQWILDLLDYIDVDVLGGLPDALKFEALICDPGAFTPPPP